MEGRELIVRRAAKFFRDGDLVNLGIGMPTQVANYLPEGVEIQLQSENGFIGIGPTPAEDAWDHDVVNAGGQPASILAGGCTFDSCMSFGLIRGGHVNATVLGALEVDQEGNLANWIIPGKKVPGMGGGMDLVAGANQVIVTELCVLHYNGQGLVLEELAPGVTVEEVRAKTEADLMIPDEIGCMV